MANNGIRGITIELNGDTTGLDNALRDVNRQSKSLQGELKEVEKALKLDPSNAELVAQKMRLLQQSVDSTQQRLLTLRTAHQQVEQQFQSGRIDETQYRAFQRELINTESELRRLQSTMDSVNGDQERLTQTTNRLGTFFVATGTNVDQFADVLGTRLTQSIRNGTASADQMERALRLIGRQSLGSSTDIDELRRVLNQINDGGSIDQIRQDLNRISDSANQAQDDVNGLGDALAGVAGAVVAGGGIASVVEQALDTSNLDTKIEILFEVPEENRAYIKELIRSIEAYGVDGEEALEAVRRQWALNADATDEANRKIVEGAGVITQAYSQIDLIELIQEVNEIAVALGVTDEEALALTNTLLKTGFPPEQLDIIAEYGTQLKLAGYNAQEIQAIMASASSQNSWNIDNLLDGLKEGRIKLTEFGDSWSDALTDLIEGTNISTDMLDGWGKAVAKGGEEGSQAMRDAAKAVSEIEDPTKKALIMVEMFGTMAEDQGNTIADTLIEMGQHMTTAAENQEGLNEAIDKMDKDPTVQLRQALADLKTALDPVIQVVADIVAQIASWVSENSKLAGIILAVTTAIGIIVGAIMALAPAIASLVYLFTPLVTAITTAGGVAGVLSSTIGTLAPIFTALTGPIGIAVVAITGIVTALVTAYTKFEWFRDGINAIWTTIKDYTAQAFGAVKELVSTLISSTVDFAKGILDKFKGFWDENGQAIMSLVQEHFGKVKSNIEMVMGIIKGVFEVIWPIISNTVRVTWETIQLVIETALDLILGVIQTVMKLIEGDWKGAWESIKGIGENIMNNIIKFFKDIDLAQTGKDIIRGLVNGIGSMVGAVKKKVEELAANIPAWAKKMLGIHSPSRVMKQVGLWTGEGLAIGIMESETPVNKAMEDIYNSIISISDKYGKEQKSLQAELNKSLAKDMKSKAEIQKKYDDQISKMRKDSDKEYLSAIESFINDKKSLEQLSLADEAAIWEQSVELFVTGTDERIKAQQNYKKAIEAVNKEITSINENYQSKMQAINDKLIKDIQTVNEEYDKAFDDRVKSIRNSTNLFDEFVANNEKAGFTLLTNLQSQVDGLKVWKETLASLGGRITDEGLMNELTALGPNSLGELQALNSLSDEELSKYVGLYNEKFALAREQATIELSGMKEDTVLRIAEMTEAANEELAVLQMEWMEAIKGVTKSTSNELTSMTQIGKNAGQGLLNGLDSMKGPLIAKALEIANSIISTIQSALGIHSPSVVMKGFGNNIGGGLVIGMDEMINKVAQSSARLSEAVINAQASLASSAYKSMANGSNVNNSTSTVDNRKSMSNTINIYTQQSGEQAMKRTLRRLAFEFN